MSKFLKRILSNVLAEDELNQIFSSFDIIGNIAIIKIPESLSLKKNIIGQSLLSNIPHIESVFLQNSPVMGEYRLRELELIAGEEKYITTYKEHNCTYVVNVASTYFSPRLSTERLRISRLVSENEKVVNMFAGVGTFSILLAKKPNVLVYSIDSNLDAYILSLINSKLNKVEDKVISLHGKAQVILKSDCFIDSVDRILLPLPEKAFEFIDLSINCIKPSGGILHFFAHVKSDTKMDVKSDSEDLINKLFSKYNFQIKHTQIVRDVAPRIYQTVSDILIKK